MDQSGSIAHVGDGGNTSCLGQEDLPVLFRKTHRWDEEQCRLAHLHSERNVLPALRRAAKKHLLVEELYTDGICLMEY